MEVFRKQERCKSKLKFGGIKVRKAEEVRKYFENPKIGNEVFGWCVDYIICSLDFRNTEAVVRRCSSEKIFLKNYQYSQEKL